MTEWVHWQTGAALLLPRLLGGRRHGPVFLASRKPAIAANAGLDDKATAHIGRHTFATTLIRAGEDLVLVAELLGHARLDTGRSYSQPTADGKHNALRHLTVDR